MRHGQAGRGGYVMAHREFEVHDIERLPRKWPFPRGICLGRQAGTGAGGGCPAMGKHPRAHGAPLFPLVGKQEPALSRGL